MLCTLVIEVQVTEVTMKGAQIIDVHKCEIPDGKYPFITVGYWLTHVADWNQNKNFHFRELERD